ncbi:MAG: NADH-quinone oxidoreductase subunit A [Bacteroidia bacterium]
MNEGVGYIGLIVLIALAIVLGLLLTSFGRLFGPYRPNKVKEVVYESGMDPVGTAHERFAVKFYLTAMLFILFDIEVVFMYPWAVNYTKLLNAYGAFPFIEMLVFIVILFVGYIYVYKKGGLDWD